MKTLSLNVTRVNTCVPSFIESSTCSHFIRYLARKRLTLEVSDPISAIAADFFGIAMMPAGPGALLAQTSYYMGSFAVAPFQSWDLITAYKPRTLI